MFEELPKDIIRLILSYLHYSDLKKIVIINKNFCYNICNRQFWIYQIANKYRFSLSDIDKYRGNNSYQSYYFFLDMNCTIYKPYGLIKRGIDINRIDLVILAVERDILVSTYFLYAFKNRRYEIIRYMLTYKIMKTPEIAKYIVKEAVSYLNSPGTTDKYDLLKFLYTDIISNCYGIVKGNRFWEVVINKLTEFKNQDILVDVYDNEIKNLRSQIVL